MDPLPSILKLFNAVIHISPKCFVRFLTIELSAKSVFFPFIEPFYGMSKVFNEKLASYKATILHISGVD